MAKYINAEDLTKTLREMRTKHAVQAVFGPDQIENAIQAGTCEGIAQAIELLPDADVQEVKHGEWVFKFYCGNMSGYDYGMNCSVCGKPTYRQFAEKMPPFCHNCGASMDGDTE